MAVDPIIAVAAMDPMARDPDGLGTGPQHPAAADPHPASLPGPITWSPHVGGPRRGDDDLGRWRRRGLADDDGAWRRGGDVGGLFATGQEQE